MWHREISASLGDWFEDGCIWDVAPSSPIYADGRFRGALLSVCTRLHGATSHRKGILADNTVMISDGLLERVLPIIYFLLLYINSMEKKCFCRHETHTIKTDQDERNVVKIFIWHYLCLWRQQLRRIALNKQLLQMTHYVSFCDMEKVEKPCSASSDFLNIISNSCRIT